MRFMLWLRREQLGPLAPEGATVDDTWVVCLAHRPRDPLGVATYGILAWHPLIPCATRDDAAALAERIARASLGEGDKLGWEPVVDDHGHDTPARELWVTRADGTEHRAEVAIAPLSMLAYD